MNQTKTPQFELDTESKEKLAELELESNKFKRLQIIRTVIYMALPVAVSIAVLIGNVPLIRWAGLIAMIALTITFLWFRKALQTHFDRCNEIIGIEFDEND